MKTIKLKDLVFILERLEDTELYEQEIAHLMDIFGDDVFWEGLELTRHENPIMKGLRDGTFHLLPNSMIDAADNVEEV